MPERTPIVWVAQDHRRIVNGKEVPVHDISPAEKFGQIRYVVSPGIKPWHPTQWLPEMRRAMSEFRADIDYLLLLGSPIHLSDLYAMAVDKALNDEFTHVRRLYWHNGSRQYVEVAVPIRDVTNIDWSSVA